MDDFRDSMISKLEDLKLEESSFFQLLNFKKSWLKKALKDNPVPINTSVHGALANKPIQEPESPRVLQVARKTATIIPFPSSKLPPNPFIS